jgi:2-methylaconitate cis-trans-isomerase PrpF
VFVAASDLGLAGTELPDALDADAGLLHRLGEIRLAASVAMGLARSRDEAAAIRMIPMIACVAAPQDGATLSGDPVPADAADLLVRMLSNGQPHRALPLTGSLCTAVAAQIEGSVPHRLMRPGRAGALRLAMPSGVLTLDASVRCDRGQWIAERGSFYRTTRRLFDGFVYV